MDTAEIDARTTGTPACPAEAKAAEADEASSSRPLPSGGDAIHFPRGLPGFPAATRFGLEPVPGTGDRFLFLNSLDHAALRFIVMPFAGSIVPLDGADLGDACSSLGVPADDALALLVVTAQPGTDGLRFYVNLRAPIILDVRQRMAAQYVLPHADYPIRHPLPARR
jgi:flagellar assembly factor FliW